MSLNPDTPAHLPALVAATFHPGAIRAAWVQRCMRVWSGRLLSVAASTTVQQKSRLVAAQLPGLLDERDQRRGIDGERSRLGSPLFGDLVEIGLCFRQPGDKMPAQLCQIAAPRVAEYLRRCGVADRQRRRQRKDAVTQVLLAAASECGQPLHIADIVATVIEQAQQAAEGSQLARAIAEAGADFEHRAGVFACDLAPVRNAQGLTTQPPLQA